MSPGLGGVFSVHEEGASPKNSGILRLVKLEPFCRHPAFGKIQQTIPSLKEIGKYTPDSWHRQCGPLLILEMN
jgi:hypothetical protein